MSRFSFIFRRSYIARCIPFSTGYWPGRVQGRRRRRLLRVAKHLVRPACDGKPWNECNILMESTAYQFPFDAWCKCFLLWYLKAFDMQIYFSVEEYLETVYGRRMIAKEVFFFSISETDAGIVKSVYYWTRVKNDTLCISRNFCPLCHALAERFDCEEILKCHMSQCVTTRDEPLICDVEG